MNIAFLQSLNYSIKVGKYVKKDTSSRKRTHLEDSEEQGDPISHSEHPPNSCEDFEDKFRSLFEHSPLGISYHRMIYDEKDQYWDYRFLDVNDLFIEFTGINPRGKTLREAFPGIENDPADWINTYGEIAKNGGTLRFQQYLELNDRWYDVAAFQSSPDHFVTTFLDITAQKRTEEQLIQAQKMDAIGQLASGVAHDFNNMLGGILGGLELLENTLEQDSTSMEYLDMVKDAAERAAELTVKLLSFSRKNISQSETLDVHKAIKGAASILSHSMDKRVAIRTIFETERSIIEGSLSQLQNVFLNLGINAAQAMPEGGDLFFITRFKHLNESYCNKSIFNLHPGDYIEISVKDTGTGIPLEIQSRIFDPFFTTKEQGQGTGLGLSAVFNSVFQHHGEITLESLKGQGASFKLLFPLSQGKPEDIKSSPAMEQGEGIILIVDDEPVIRSTVERLLSILGYGVILAENGIEAMRLLNDPANHIDLVLLDMVMPVMNGKECFERIKKMDPLMPVILSSGFSDEEDISRMFEQGLDAFIRKPFHSHELGRIISDILQHRGKNHG